MYRSRFSWPRQYLEVSGQFPTPTALPLGKDPDINWTGGWEDPRARQDSVQNSDSSVIQPVASRYTKCSTVALFFLWDHS
jgi:hypothetical protein